MKPRVLYLEVGRLVVVGRQALLYVVGHSDGSGWALTTPVQAIDGEMIETLNTVYVRQPPEDRAEEQRARDMLAEA